jgi:hypothetical protein
MRGGKNCRLDAILADSLTNDSFPVRKLTSMVGRTWPLRPDGAMPTRERDETMESNSTAIKPVAPTSASSSRHEQTQTAAPLALPRGKTVNPVEPGSESSEVAGKPPATAKKSDVEVARDDRKIEIDPETREVLFKVTDADTGMVRWQVPAEALLNMRPDHADDRPTHEADQSRGPEAKEAGSKLERQV